MSRARKIIVVTALAGSALIGGTAAAVAAAPAAPVAHVHVVAGSDMFHNG